jgi:hypothetical protein
MNWDDIKNDPATQKTLAHWQKLGVFRKNHPSVGAGVHQKITAKPYVFSRSYSKENYSDQVVIGFSQRQKNNFDWNYLPKRSQSKRCLFWKRNGCCQWESNN